MSRSPDSYFSISAERLLECTCLLIFILAASLYYFQFTADLDRYLYTDRFFQLALNSHDHQIYFDLISVIQNYGFEYGLNNDVGIATIYVFIIKVFPFLVNQDLTLISFLFNVVIFIYSYSLWIKICDYYGLGLYSKLIFFINTTFIYFLQLINKDMLTVFFFIWAVHAGTQKRYFLFFLALPLMFLVRQQLAIFGILFVVFMVVKRPIRLMLAAYVVTSIAAGLLSVFASVIGEESLGDGFGAFLVQFNSQYYIGYLLFNPIRVVQYVFDVLGSFWFFTPEGGVDVAKILRLPVLFFFMTAGGVLIRLCTQFRSLIHSPSKVVIVAIVSYLLAWLINPTVNARYVMLITPLLMLFVLQIRQPSQSLSTASNFSMDGRSVR